MAKDNDKELIDKIRSGDMYAFESLIQKYEGSLFGFLSSMYKDKNTIMDILQESFVKFYYSIKRIKNFHSVKAFLFTIARNKMIDYIRKNKIKEVPIQEEYHLIHDPVGADNGDLEDIITTLDKDERAIVNLFFKFNFMQREIAETLDIPLGTVKSKLYNVVKKIRRLRNDKMR